MSTCEVLHQYDRVAPPFCAELLAKFGQNPLGENIFRVVWSESRFEQAGGTWDDRLHADRSNAITVTGNFIHDTNPVINRKSEYRWVPVYGFENPRWILEKWLPTKMSYEAWYDEPVLLDAESGLHLLGPYPEQGEFHLCYKLENRGKFVPLSFGMVEYYARLIEGGKEYSKHHQRAARITRVAKKKRDYDNRFDAIWDDAQPAFGVDKIMSAAGKKSADRKRPEDVTFGDANKLPSWVPREAGFRQV